MDLLIYPDNSLIAEVVDAFNLMTRRFLNSGSGSIIIRDLAGTQVAGVSWPVTLSYVAQSRGKFRGVIPATAVFVAGDEYVATISVTSAGYTTTWTERIPAVLRAA